MWAGIGYLMKKNKIEVIKGSAKFINATQLSIAETKETIEGKHIVIATGSHANTIPAAAPDGKVIITAREALTLTSLPKNIIVVGARCYRHGVFKHFGTPTAQR